MAYRKGVLKMAVRTYKGVYYGTFIKGENWEEIEELIIASGLLSELECIDPETPNEFYPFPNYDLIGMTYDGNSVIDKTRLFMGAKLDGKYEQNKEKIDEINQQLDDFFSKVHSLEKEESYKIHALSVIS